MPLCCRRWHRHHPYMAKLYFNNCIFEVEVIVILDGLRYFTSSQFPAVFMRSDFLSGLYVLLDSHIEYLLVQEIIHFIQSKEKQILFSWAIAQAGHFGSKLAGTLTKIQ